MNQYKYNFRPLLQTISLNYESNSTIHFPCNNTFLNELYSVCSVRKWELNLHSAGWPLNNNYTHASLQQLYVKFWTSQLLHCFVLQSTCKNLQLVSTQRRHSKFIALTQKWKRLLSSASDLSFCKLPIYCKPAVYKCKLAVYTCKST